MLLKPQVRNFVYWQAEAYEKALGRNGDFENPIDGRECYHVAKSVARWTWNKFDIAASDARHAARIAATHTSEIQAERGRKSGEARRAGSITEAKPWEAEGISRATWYRRQSGLIVPESCRDE